MTPTTELFSVVTDMKDLLTKLDVLFSCFVETNTFRGRRIHLNSLPDVVGGGRGVIAYRDHEKQRTALTGVVHSFDRDWYTVRIGTECDIDMRANVPSDVILSNMPRLCRTLEALGFDRITATSVPRNKAMRVACVTGDFGIMFSFERDERCFSDLQPVL